MKQQKKNSPGFTLPELLFSAALNTIALLVIGQGIVLLKASSKRLDLLAELTSTKVDILTALSCKQTFASQTSRPPCGAEQYIDVRSAPSLGFPSGKVLVASNGTKIGAWTFRAKCTNWGVEIRGAAIRPEFQSEQTSLTTFTAGGKPDPSKYRLDNTSSAGINAFSWAHPLAIVSESRENTNIKKTQNGLCTEYFRPKIVYNKCPSGSYLKNLDFDSNEITCGSSQQCLFPQTLKFDGTKFVCTQELVDRVRAEANMYLQNRKTTVSNQYNSQVNYIKNEINRLIQIPATLFNSADDYVVGGSSKSACKKNETVRCKSGWVMISYEFRYDDDMMDKCSATCRRLKR
jgi:hypothetical protein